MQNRNATVGPRGWAMLTLIAGATLACPFLRAPRVDVGGGTPQLSTARPTAAPAAQASVGAAFDWSELSPAASNASGAATPQLPAWASPPSPLDHLIAQGTAPPWQGDAQSGTGPRPLQAWVGEVAQRPVPAPTPSTIAATAWPAATVTNLQPDPRQEIRPSPLTTSPSSAGLAVGQTSMDSSRSPGALAGTTHRSATLRSDGPTSHERRAVGPPASAVPSPPQFVYQPGFRSQTAK